MLTPRTRVVLLAALALAACQPDDERPAPGPQFREAKRMLLEVQAAAVDPDYEDPRFDAVRAAFAAVPADSPDRPLADYWVARIGSARAEARARRARVADEVRALGEKSARIPAMLPVHVRQQIGGDTPPPNPSRASRPPAEPPAASGVPTEDADHNNRTREYWQVRHRELRRYVRQLAAKLKYEQELVTVYCRGQGVAPHTPGSEAGGLVRQADLAELSHGPRGQIAREDPTLVACEQHKGVVGDVRARLEAARRELDGLADEARRAGAPPGWLRLKDEPPLEEKTEPRVPEAPPAVKP